MSDQVIPPVAENKNQATPEVSKPDGQAPAAPVADPAKAPDPAPVVAPVIDPSTTPAIEPPKPDDQNAPVAFELKKADGSLLDAAEAEKIVSFSKEHGLSPAQAQAIYNRENAALTALDQDVVKQYEERRNGWIEAGKKDPVLGGEHYAQNVQAAHLMFEKFSTPEFTQLLKDTGFGDHPELLKVFFNIHQAHKDDVLVRQGESPTALKDTKDVMYGETTK